MDRGNDSHYVRLSVSLFDFLSVKSQFLVKSTETTVVKLRYTNKLD